MACRHVRSFLVFMGRRAARDREPPILPVTLVGVLLGALALVAGVWAGLPWIPTLLGAVVLGWGAMRAMSARWRRLVRRRLEQEHASV